MSITYGRGVVDQKDDKVRHWGKGLGRKVNSLLQKINCFNICIEIDLQIYLLFDVVANPDNTFCVENMHISATNIGPRIFFILDYQPHRLHTILQMTKYLAH